MSLDTTVIMSFSRFLEVRVGIVAAWKKNLLPAESKDFLFENTQKLLGPISESRFRATLSQLPGSSTPSNGPALRKAQSLYCVAFFIFFSNVYFYFFKIYQ